MLTDALLQLAGSNSAGVTTGWAIPTSGTGTFTPGQAWDTFGNNWVSNAQDWGMGGGPDITWLVEVATAPTFGVSGTVQFAIQGSNTLASGYTSVLFAPASAVTTLPAGTVYTTKIPRAALASYRYYQFAAIVGVAQFTGGGAINSWIGEPGLFQDNRPYPANYTV